ncbi:MAG: hypothetical protein IJC15_01340, partial [Clostridia bacterium]|nr:hypothetical protein [Clostridia bacterium]
MKANLFMRILAGLLATLTLGTLAACAGGDPAETTVAPTVTTAPAGETEAPETEPEDPRASIKDDLPEGLTFDGRTFTIYVGDKMRN